MPGRIMEYSGLITKTRAMKASLLTNQELQQLAEQATVNEAIGYLRGTRGYGTVFQNHEGLWHRGQAEEIITNSLARDFEKLYRFASGPQRQGFQYVFWRYELDFLKSHLKWLVLGEEMPRQSSPDEFFYRHACFSVADLRKASTLAEFRQCLAGTRYQRIAGAGEMETLSYVDYATQMDSGYYSQVFQAVKHSKSGTERTILLEIYGTEIDWLNILAIYRSKRFYQQTQAELYATLIPHTYRLKKQELQALIESASIQELNGILENTSYFKGKQSYLHMEDEISYRDVITRMYGRLSQKYAMSIAPVLEYLYHKEQEINHITTVIEGIRYQIPSREIKDMILLTT